MGENQRKSKTFEKSQRKIMHYIQKINDKNCSYPPIRKNGSQRPWNDIFKMLKKIQNALFIENIIKQ